VRLSRWVVGKSQGKGENADLMGGNDGECNLASMGNLALARLDGSVICVLMWP